MFGFPGLSMNNELAKKQLEELKTKGKVISVYIDPATKGRVAVVDYYNRG